MKGNMTAKRILTELHREPFKAFFLQLDNGTKIKVEHPECIAFTGRRTECVVAEGLDDLHYLRLSHVSGLSYLTNGRQGPSKNVRRKK
jgi:hypothetical protein